MDYIETAIAEAVATAEAQETKVETTPAAPETEQVEATETEETTTEETAEESKEPDEVEQLKIENKKVKNANSRKEKKITKLAAERDMWRQRAAEYEQKLAAPAPREEDFADKPYEQLLDAKAQYYVDKKQNEQALEAAKNQATELETELNESAKAAIDESGEIARKTFPDFDKVIKSHAAQFPSGKLEFSQAALDAIERSDDGAAAIYAVLVDGKFDVLNSLPPIEAAMMIKEYEIKAQSLPKIKHVSSAPEPITSARGVGSGTKSVENLSGKELLALTR